jgi:hypothetical protein
MAKDVLQKLEDMYGKANEAEKAIIDFLKVWIAEDESAAEKVGADKKTPGGAYNAMRDFAKGKSIQCLHGKEAWVQVMKYYGEDETSADQKLEHGLMFACMRAEIEKWKPYGADVPSVKSTPEPKQESEKKKAEFDMSLADFGL